jgi:hypothetical protein
VQSAVVAAGLIWLEPEALDVPLSGLVLQHYGEAREWTVGEYVHVLAEAEGYQGTGRQPTSRCARHSTRREIRTSP